MPRLDRRRRDISRAECIEPVRNPSRAGTPRDAVNGEARIRASCCSFSLLRQALAPYATYSGTPYRPSPRHTRAQHTHHGGHFLRHSPFASRSAFAVVVAPHSAGAVSSASPASGPHPRRSRHRNRASRISARRSNPLHLSGPRKPRAPQAVRHPAFGRPSSLTLKHGGGLTPACSGLATLAADARR